MAPQKSRKPLFRGLVFNEQGEPVEVAYVGAEPCYVVPDAGFRRHVPAEYVDRQVLRWLKEQIMANRNLITQETLSLWGRDDLFSKAMVDSSIENLDQLLDLGLPDDALTWLGLFGFRITVDVHGEVLEITAPTTSADE